MLWRMPVDTHEQRIDAMHTAQLSLDALHRRPEFQPPAFFHRPKRAALTALTPGMARAPGTADWWIACGNCGNPYRRPAVATRDTAFFEVKWRMGWDSNPRCACTHAGFQDRCLKPLGHPSGMRLLLRPRQRVHIRPPP